MTVASTELVAPRAPRIRPLFVAFIGLPVLGLLGFFWLGIPDSHAWELVVSLVAGLLIAASLAWITSATIRALRQPIAPCSHVLGALLLLVWMCVKWTLIGLVERIDDNASARAGYIVSKQSAPTRTTFTYERLVAWQHDAMLLLLWVVLPILLTPFVIETVSRGLRGSTWRAASRTVLRWQHWLTIIVCDGAIYWLTGKLTGWQPSHSVRGELFSLGFRLALCYTLDFALIVLLLAIDSYLLARDYAGRDAAAQPAANVS